MRRHSALILALALGCSGAPAAGVDGFVPLFNGKDLSGWVNVNGGPETWSVRDNMIITSGHPNGVLRSGKMYENFVLELEWSHQIEGGNSGLFVHSGALPIRGNCFTKAFECQIMLGDDPKGMWTRHGDLFAIQGAHFVPDRPHPQGWERCLPSENRVKGAGEWNHYRVISMNGSIKLEANGKEVSGGTKCNPRKGYICLESEGAECHFRNLRIKELPSSNPPAQQVSEADEGFKTLYGGDLRGWYAPGIEKEECRPNDWVLEMTAPGFGLATERKFKDFKLICDWRLPKSAKHPSKEGPMILVSNSPGSTLGISLSAPESKPGQWNRCILTVKGNFVTLVVNDVKTRDNEKTFDAHEKEVLVLKNGTDAVQFANIYIKELD